MMNRRRALFGGSGDMVIMTSDTNPKTLKVLYDAGLCASPDVMYKSEAEAVPDGTFGTGYTDEYNIRPVSPFDFTIYGYSNRPVNEDFSAFQYFTQITGIGYYAFCNCDFSNIVLPPTCKHFGYRCLRTNNFKFIEVPLAYTGLKPDGTLNTNTQCFYYGTGNRDRSIYFPHKTPPQLQYNAWLFIGTISAMEAIYVPDDCVDAYRTAWANNSLTSTGASSSQEWLALIKPVSEYYNEQQGGS